MNIKKILKTSSGQTSIIITMILAIVISIIFLGITRTTSSQSQSDINGEEQDQANYAAQSGINDTINLITSGWTPPSFNTQDCSTVTTALTQHHFATTISSSPNVSYSCVYVQSQPSTLQFNVTQTQSTVVPVSPSGPTNTLTVQWSASVTGPGYNLSNCTVTTPQFAPPANYSCPFSVIRMDLYRTNASDSNAAAFTADTDSFFLIPTDTSGQTHTVTFGSQTPSIVQAGCDAASDTCTATLQFNPPGPQFSAGYARLTSIYYDAGQVTIGADAGINFGSTQLQIDATGIDQDVAQRLSVRVPVSTTTNTGTAPNYAAAGAYMCKHYQINSSGVVPAGQGLDSGNAPPLCINALKPAIYLYPTVPELVNVKVNYAPGFKLSIPQYNSLTGWNVLAQPNGSLLNVTDGKTYPYLYWEGNYGDFNYDLSKGFVVPGSGSRQFLESELPKIGLNPAETSAFIAYWLPKMDKNAYTLIHFAGDEYSDAVPLDITPKPDSLLRLFMVIEPLARPITVTPQSFTPFVRHGFTAVEWGGAVVGQ